MHVPKNYSDKQGGAERFKRIQRHPWKSTFYADTGQKRVGDAVLVMSHNNLPLNVFLCVLNFFAKLYTICFICSWIF